MPPLPLPVGSRHDGPRSTVGAAGWWRRRRGSLRPPSSGDPVPYRSRSRCAALHDPPRDRSHVWLPAQEPPRPFPSSSSVPPRVSRKWLLVASTHATTQLVSPIRATEIYPLCIHRASAI